MPRDGSGIYSRPPGTNGVPDTTIESTKYNGFVGDVETDLNAPRPIIAGGTGASSAAAARDNLDAERAFQTVTNYDTHPWESGSFYSAPGATGAPNPTSYFLGTAITDNAITVSMLEAVDISAADHPHYIRFKNGGLWSAWVKSAVNDTDYVKRAGDTMTGDLTVTKSQPVLILNKTGDPGNAIVGQRNGLRRWIITIGGADGETGGNAGSGFYISRCDDAGNVTSDVIGINRATGWTNLGGEVQFGSAGFATGGLASSQTPGAGNTLSGWTMRQDANGPLMYWNASNFGRIYIGQNIDGALLNWTRGGSVVGSIGVSGTSTAYNTASDERLKDDLKSFDAGNIIDDTKVYDFAWKATGERAYGVIAQQAIEVYPTAVTHTEKDEKSERDEWWGVDYSKYVPVILQELKALRARVAELEGKTDTKPPS